MCKFHAWSNSGNTHIHHTATDTTVLNNFRLKRNNQILIKKTATDTNVLNDHHDRHHDIDQDHDHHCDPHHENDDHEYEQLQIDANQQTCFAI